MPHQREERLDASEGERARIIGDLERQVALIDQYFIDVAYWNEHVRRPGEEPIDPDPDGQLARVREAFAMTLALDAGEGKIVPIPDDVFDPPPDKGC